MGVGVSAEVMDFHVGPPQRFQRADDGRRRAGVDDQDVGPHGLQGQQFQQNGQRFRSFQMRNGDRDLMIPRLPGGRAFPGVLLAAAGDGSDGRRGGLRRAWQDRLAARARVMRSLSGIDILHGLYQPRGASERFHCHRSLALAAGRQESRRHLLTDHGSVVVDAVGFVNGFAGQRQTGRRDGGRRTADGEDDAGADVAFAGRRAGRRGSRWCQCCSRPRPSAHLPYRYWSRLLPSADSWTVSTAVQVGLVPPKAPRSRMKRQRWTSDISTLPVVSVVVDVERLGVDRRAADGQRLGQVFGVHGSSLKLGERAR